MTKDTKNGSKLYFKILKTWKNWESTRITSIPFPFLRTSFPIPSGQIPVPATQIPFSHSKNRSIPVPILPLQDPLETVSHSRKAAILKRINWVLLGSSLIFYFVAIDLRSTIHYRRKMRAETYTRQGTGAPASKKDSKQRELDYLPNCFAKTGGGTGVGSELSLVSGNYHENKVSVVMEMASFCLKIRHVFGFTSLKPNWLHFLQLLYSSVFLALHLVELILEC